MPRPKDDPQARPVDGGRRRFLKSLALLGGAAATASASPLTARATAAPLRVGVLLPSGPSGGEAAAQPFLAGLRLGLESEESVQAELLSEETGPSGVLSYRKAAQLSSGYGVDALVGLLGSQGEGLLRARLEERELPLLASSLGENAIRAEDRHDLIFRHSLHAWQAEWALGNWAGQTTGSDVFLMSSLADSGYDLSNAFAAGFEAAGGEVADRIVSDATGRHDWGALFTRLGNEQPALVHAHYTGSAALSFVRAYARSGLESRLLLGGSGLSQDFLASFADPRAGFPGQQQAGTAFARTWPIAAQTSEAEQFEAVYRRLRGQSAGAMALLGYESGLLLSAAAVLAAGRGRAALARALRQVAVRGPRGELSMGAHQQILALPAYLHELEGGHWRLSAELAGPSSDDELPDELLAGVRSGWGGPYLGV